MSGRLKIIYYHVISERIVDYYIKKSVITPQNLKKQISYINSRYKIITLKQAVEMNKAGEKFGNEVVITTDDGFSGNYNYLAPILSDFNSKATLFINENSIDNKSMIWRHILFQLSNSFPKAVLLQSSNKVAKHLGINGFEEKDDLLNWSLTNIPMKLKDQFCSLLWHDVQEMSIEEFLSQENIYLCSEQINGLIGEGFEIGCHTRSHPLCDKLTESEIKEEITDSKISLEKKYNTKVSSFSFPFGRSNKVTQMLSSSNVFDAILGIRENFSNQNDPHKWERICCDSSYYRSIFEIEFRPYINRIYK